MSIARHTSIRLPAGAFALALVASPAAADADEPSYRTELTVTRAAFYTIDDSGRSTRETAPTVAVIGDPDSLAFDSPYRVRARAKPAPRRARSRAYQVSPADDEHVYDPLEEFRCERFGFYYTKDNRCIAPAWGNLRRRDDVPPRHEKRYRFDVPGDTRKRPAAEATGRSVRKRP